MSFVHLHTHTEYSLLDGEASITKLVKRVKELGMSACAITDHGVMYGAVDFYRACKAEGIKPIIGCEVYVAPRSRFDKVHELDSKRYHLILLAKNHQGYQNLSYLVSAGFIDGFYYKPRIDFALLAEHSDGLICLSACLAGEVSRTMSEGDYDKAREVADRYARVFGKDNYFIEIQDHGIAEQKKLIPDLIRLAKDIGVGVVATNDIHYLTRQDARYQDVLMCVQTGKTLSDTDRMRFETEEFYVKSPEEMERLFSYVPEAIKNSCKIAEACSVDFDFNTRHLPAYALPDERTAYEYLHDLCYEGLNTRYKETNKNLIDRLEYELTTIKTMGFTDYFLIVWDFIHYARSIGVVVGPGRGSAAGSLVSYCLEITNIDPIKYDLLFERFLNPERVSMPDIDIDFEPEGRARVIDYVTQKYGKDQVCQIITFGTMKARLAIRDVGRVLDVPYADVDHVAKLIPPDFKITIDKALDMSPELRALYDTDSVVKKLIDTSRALEGLPRHTSTHAAGVVITGEPVVNYLPLQTNDDIITTQYTKDTVEQLGLLKMDFLGLRNLTVIKNAVAMVKESRGVDIDIDHIDLDIPEVYRLISLGNTDGLFQLESPGMKQFIQELAPSSLEDIIAGIAIFRPGPMEQRHDYVHNKNNPQDITYKHPLLEPILNVTYGFMVYQEQVMQIVRSLAGYSLGAADVMRRVISKKKLDQMQIEREHFIYGAEDEDGNVVIDGCIRRGIDERIAISIFDEINDFANYAFNKSHAAAYAVVAYQTAYLKTFYPAEFMAALISTIDDPGKINRYLENCRDMGIKRLPPDINSSVKGFSIDHGSIRFGLGAIKNVGNNLVNDIVAERKRNGSFKSFDDFIDRVSGPAFNKRAVDCLIRAGAFDSLGVKRSQLMLVYESMIDERAEGIKRNVAGQFSLFDEMPGDNSVEYPNVPEYSKDDLLKMEKEVAGMYFSGHPMDAYRDRLKALCKFTIYDITHAYDTDEEGNVVTNNAAIVDGAYITVAGIISNRRVRITKAKARMAMVTIEDMTGSIECVVFPKVFSGFHDVLNEGEAVFIKGRLQIREDEAVKILPEIVQSLQATSYLMAMRSKSAPCQRGEGQLQGLPQSLLCGKEEHTAKQRFGTAISRPFSDRADMRRGEGVPHKLYIKLNTEEKEELKYLQDLLRKFHGSMPVVIYIADTKKRLSVPPSLYIDPSKTTLISLKAIFGEESVVLK